MPPTHDAKYEDALKRLEKVVAELDGSELDLQTRIKKFEDGIKLSALLLKKLDQAKKKVEMLVKTQVGETAVPFDADTDEDDEDDSNN